MIADGNGFRTVRVPKHTDYYSAAAVPLGSGLTPRGGRNFRNSLRVSSRKPFRPERRPSLNQPRPVPSVTKGHPPSDMGR